MTDGWVRWAYRRMFKNEVCLNSGWAEAEVATGPRREASAEVALHLCGTAGGSKSK